MRYSSSSPLCRVQGRDHRLGIISGHDPLPSLHQLGIFVCKVHPPKPLLSKMLHGTVDAFPSALGGMELLWEPWWRRVITTFVLCLQLLDGRISPG